MAVSTFPVWIILSIVFMFILIIIAKINYYLPKIGKLRAKCVADKSKKQRNNMVLRMRRRIDEGYYCWIVLLMYIVVSICFFVENHNMLFTGELLFIKVLGVLMIWVFSALVVVCFVVALMKLLQENAVKDLKSYYFNHYGVTVIYLSKTIEKEYHEYELSN